MKQLKIYVLREIYTLLRFEESKYPGTIAGFLTNLKNAGFFSSNDERWIKAFLMENFDSCECILNDEMSYQEAVKTISNKINSL